VVDRQTALTPPAPPIAWIDRIQPKQPLQDRKRRKLGDRRGFFGVKHSEFTLIKLLYK
jgi:hypothetical protein